ncbi:MAG: hypothetical protein FJ197_09700 [Gammaproteobacteria bacterium]|nr:hypothetical protein [Gammaproteobacteria bacterium]
MHVAPRASLWMLIDAGVAGRLVLVPGSGHSPHVEFPDDFVRTVTDYCGPGARRAAAAGLPGGPIR